MICLSYKAKGLANRFLGGWQWSGITDIESGTPFSVYNVGGGNIPGDNAGVSNYLCDGRFIPRSGGQSERGNTNTPAW